MRPVNQLGGFAPLCVQSRREIAQKRRGGVPRYAQADAACIPELAGGCSSKRKSAHCQHRYPSPCRFALSQSRPAYPFLGFGRLSAAKRFSERLTLDAARNCDDSARVNKTNKGSIPCLILSSPWQRLPHLHLARVPASTQMASVRLSAQVSAVSRVKRSTAIAQPAHLSELSAAHWPTTSNVFSGQAGGNPCLIRPLNPDGACAGRTAQRVSRVLKHRQGAFSCATSYLSSQFLGLPPVQARSRHLHRSWHRTKVWRCQPSKRHLSPCPSFATPMATARHRAANTTRDCAPMITKDRCRGMTPVAVLRLKDPAHV